jgi:hypothetical protein
MSAASAEQKGCAPGQLSSVDSIGVESRASVASSLNHNVGEYHWEPTLDAWILVDSWSDATAPTSPYEPGEVWVAASAIAEPWSGGGGPGGGVDEISSVGCSAVQSASTQSANSPTPRLRQIVVRPDLPEISTSTSFLAIFTRGGGQDRFRIRVRAQMQPITIQLPGVCRSMEDDESCNIVRGYYAQGLGPGALARPPEGQVIFFRFSDGRSVEYHVRNTTACAAAQSGCR